YRASGGAGAGRNRPLRLQPHHLSLARPDGAAAGRPPQPDYLGWRHWIAAGGAVLSLPRRAGGGGCARGRIALGCLVARLLAPCLRRAALLGGNRPPLRRAGRRLEESASASADSGRQPRTAGYSAGGHLLASAFPIWRFHPSARRLNTPASTRPAPSQCLARPARAGAGLRRLHRRLRLPAVDLARGTAPAAQ